MSARLKKRIPATKRDTNLGHSPRKRWRYHLAQWTMVGVFAVFLMGSVLPVEGQPQPTVGAVIQNIPGPNSLYIVYIRVINISQEETFLLGSMYRQDGTPLFEDVNLLQLEPGETVKFSTIDLAQLCQCEWDLAWMKILTPEGVIKAQVFLRGKVPGSPLIDATLEVQDCDSHVFSVLGIHSPSSSPPSSYLSNIYILNQNDSVPTKIWGTLGNSVGPILLDTVQPRCIKKLGSNELQGFFGTWNGRTWLRIKAEHPVIKVQHWEHPLDESLNIFMTGATQECAGSNWKYVLNVPHSNAADLGKLYITNTSSETTISPIYASMYVKGTPLIENEDLLEGDSLGPLETKLFTSADLEGFEGFAGIWTGRALMKFGCSASDSGCSPDALKFMMTGRRKIGGGPLVDLTSEVPEIRDGEKGIFTLLGIPPEGSEDIPNIRINNIGAGSITVEVKIYDGYGAAIGAKEYSIGPKNYIRLTHTGGLQTQWIKDLLGEWDDVKAWMRIETDAPAGVTRVQYFMRDKTTGIISNLSVGGQQQ
jgi:hypothetical protein